MRIIILVIIGSVLFISLLGLRGLSEPDEGRYAEISREIVESGDWLTPRLNYIKHFHKPPLVYWLVSVSFFLFGMNEFTSRLPVALIGIFGLILTYLLSIRMGRDKKTGFFSGLILATTLQYFGWTQVLSSDMVFSFFILLAFYGFWKRNYLFYLGIALSFMTKGPVAVIIPALVISFYTLISKEKVFKKGQFLKGVILFFAIVSPWFIYVCMKTPGLFRYFVFFQSLDRLLTDIHGRGGNIIYFIPVVVIGGLPWVLFTPRAIKVKDKNNLFLLLWIITPIIFFSFSGSKLPGYILPIYPAFAIMIGSYFSKRGYNKLFFALCIISGIIYLSSLAIIPRFEERLRDNLSIRKPAMIIRKYGSDKDKIVNFRCFLQGLPFYMGKRVTLVEKTREIQFEKDESVYKEYIVPSIDEFFNHLKQNEKIWCFSKIDDYPDLIRISPAPLYEIWKSGYYILVSNYET